MLCLATTMVLQFFLVFILVVAFLQAFFASSLIKGTSLHDGRLPVAVNYLWPVLFGAIPVIIYFFTMREEYASTDVQLGFRLKQ